MSHDPFLSDEPRSRNLWIYVAGIAVAVAVGWWIYKSSGSPGIKEDIAIRPITAPDSTLNTDHGSSPQLRSGQTASYICDTVLHIKYQKIENGTGGFRKGKIIESNSVECGYTLVPLKNTIANGFICDNVAHIKYARLNDGQGGYQRGVMLEQNSVECGFIAPPIEKIRPPVARQSPAAGIENARSNNVTPPTKKAVNIEPIAPAIAKEKIQPGSSACIKGAAIGRPYCGQGANAGKLLQKKCNGKGGFYVDVIDPCTTECECGEISPRDKPLPVIKN